MAKVLQEGWLHSGANTALRQQQGETVQTLNPKLCRYCIWLPPQRHRDILLAKALSATYDIPLCLVMLPSELWFWDYYFTNILELKSTLV